MSQIIQNTILPSQEISEVEIQIITLDKKLNLACTTNRSDHQMQHTLDILPLSTGLLPVLESH